MIKRMNKVTSLLVAAAAIVSVVPANAAEKLATQEGTIYNAVAFDGGKYLFEGYKNEDDDSVVYFNDGSKDKALEDLEDYTEFRKYDNKTVIAKKDGDTREDDQYFIDMSTGKATDDETMEDIKLNLQSKLNSLLRKTDRYEDAADKKAVVSDEDLTLVTGGTFSDVWFEYKATTGNAADVYGYTNASAKYIDASVTANMSVLSSTGTKMVKVEEFNKAKDGVKVVIDGEPLTIAQDDNYIYRIVDVKITGGQETSAKYLQKISKAQGDKKDDAYLPKTVESYEISGTLDNDDVKDAYAELIEDEAGNAIDVISYRVVDGNLYTVRINGNKVVVAKYTTKRNEKIDYGTKELDTAVLKLVDTVDVKADQNSRIADRVVVDVNGSVWVMNKGKIYSSVKGGDFEVVYTCDSTMDKIDVYNKSNLIVWNESNEIFATVQGVEKEEEKEEVVETVKTGWQSENGTWYLYDVAGNKLTGWQLVNGTWYYMDPTTAAMRTGWVSVNGTWYYMQSSGAMKTGWLLDGSTWYYMQSSGAMATGWLNDNGTWYYLNANGSMAANTTVDGYVLGANGAWVR